MQYAQSLLDLVKAFEKLPHHLIIAAAIKHGYDLWVIRLSLAAYRMPRTVGIDGAFSRIVIAVCGITAGSGFATSELRLLMIDVVSSVARAWPIVEITLYVDDITLEAMHHSTTVVQCVVAGATDHVISHLQDDYGLEVSEKKSLTVGGKLSIAAGIAAISRARKLTAHRATKLLGAPSGGGRRRSTQTLKVRMSAFSKRIPRIQRLRWHGVNTVRVTRASGTPMLTYGVDVAGMSSAHLLNARRMIARAIAPVGGGKSADLVLYTADAAGGTLDPAFDAHVQPLQSWSLACWQKWQPLESMRKVMRHARERIMNDGKASWAKVSGPAAAALATADRIGWTFISGDRLHCDDGTVLDLHLDPPVVVAEAVKRAVRRWRLGRIIKSFPELVPGLPDIVAEGLLSPVRTTLIDFSDVLARLSSRGKVSTCAVFDAWEAKYRADLTSAVCGGQWPQARLASVPGWVDDNRCQLCLSEPGTLPHRLVCEATRPPEGWQPPPEECERIQQKLSAQRQMLLSTRGLLVLKVSAPQPPTGDTFEWLIQPPLDIPQDAIWYIDGSLFDEARRFARRTGFGIVVVGSDQSLLACGCGTPPNWISDATGAEAWGLQVVARLTSTLPSVITDCFGIVQTLRGGAREAVSPKRKLARVWGMIVRNIDGDFGSACEKVTWMPAHTSLKSIGHAQDSNGAAITAIMWRANRLVDLLAKSAALQSRLPKKVTQFVARSAKLVEHQAARLGTATHLANNHKITVTLDGGATEIRTVRDSTAIRTSWSSKQSRRVLGAAACNISSVVGPKPIWGTQGSLPLAWPSTVARCSKGATFRKPWRKRTILTAPGRARHHAAVVQLEQLKERLVDEKRVAGWLASRKLTPSSLPPAADRFDALKSRIREKHRRAVAGVET